MRTQVKEQMVINAPADKVWQILAHDFDKIGLWSSGINESLPLDEPTTLKEAPTSGRICLTDGFGGDVTEQFTYYEEGNMRFGYQAVGDLPIFFKKAENNWHVESLEPDKTVVAFRAEIDVTLFPGIFLILLKPIMRHIWGTRTLEELKYFVEHHLPHPRKQKILQVKANTI